MTDQEKLAEIRCVIEQGYPGQPKGAEQCVHQRFGWEDCIACYDVALLAVLDAA